MPFRALPAALRHLAIAVTVVLGIAWKQPPVTRGNVPTPERRAQLERVLPDQPAGLGQPASDRATWTRAAAALPLRDILALAEQTAQETPPELSDALFLSYHETGNRMPYQEPYRQRLSRLGLFAWAEALEHRGRFLPALERELYAILAEKTWVMPAHDPTLINFHEQTVEVDLGAAARGWAIATVAYWHADQLREELRERIRHELRRRIIAPYLATVRGERTDPIMWWIKADMNWNAVCHAGVVGTALASEPSRADRAEIVACAEANFPDYLSGFTADGYCSEGVGYWNYGFGAATRLAEMLHTATAGTVRLLEGEHAAAIAPYPWHLEILAGVYPAFADMSAREQASPWIGLLAQRQLSRAPLGVSASPFTAAGLASAELSDAALRVFLPLATAQLPSAHLPQTDAARHWFGNAQVYVGRASARFGAAIKGGHNGELHNHNDVGSFVVAVNDRAVLLDPGSEVYTRRTFSPQRYDSKVINSYGHAVPIVAGHLQSEGEPAHARVLSTSFSEDEDRIVLDLSAAYAVPTLRSLTRTFVLRRGANPEILISDKAEFSAPETFGSAVLTFGRSQAESDATLQVTDGASAVAISIDAAGAAWTLQAEEIAENLPGGKRPTRLGFDLTQPSTTATLTVRVRPASATKN